MELRGEICEPKGMEKDTSIGIAGIRTERGIGDLGRSGAYAEVSKAEVEVGAEEVQGIA